LSSPEKDGVERIKKVCGEIDRNGEKVKVRINYLSAPLYELKVEATNFKDAEAELKDTLIRTKNLAKELNLDISFQRKGKRNE
jgi:translation initiation factor 2 alpha subunit (eIF-2alpha)